MRLAPGQGASLPVFIPQMRQENKKSNGVMELYSVKEPEDLVEGTSNIWRRIEYLQRSSRRSTKGVGQALGQAFALRAMAVLQEAYQRNFF